MSARVAHAHALTDQLVQEITDLRENVQSDEITKCGRNWSGDIVCVIKLDHLRLISFSDTNLD